MVAKQDTAYNQRENPDAEEKFWNGKEIDSPAVISVVHGERRDPPDKEGDSDSATDSETDGEIESSDEENDVGSDMENEEEPRMLAVQTTAEKAKRVGWKGRGVSALFLVDKAFNNLAAVHLFKVSSPYPSHDDLELIART